LPEDKDKDCRLALLGHLQLEIVHIHLQSLVAGGQLIDVGLDGFHSGKKGCGVQINAVFRRNTAVCD